MIKRFIVAIADLFAQSRLDLSALAPTSQGTRLTLREDAERFVRYLIERAPIMTRHFNGAFAEYESRWPGMSNDAWRAEVLRLVAERHANMLTSPKFAAPCQLDSEWQFSCYSAVRGIPQLSLDDVMP